MNNEYVSNDDGFSGSFIAQVSANSIFTFSILLSMQ